MSILIETERTILREFEISDSKAVFEFGSDPVVQRYTGDAMIASEKEAGDIIQNVFKKDYKTYGYGRLAVNYKPDDKLIGFAGLKYLPEYQLTDIGFRFLSDYWGMGLATEVSRAIIDHGFQELGIKTIVGIAMPENKASCRVLEKLGFHNYKDDDYEGDGKRYHWFKLESPNNI